MNFGEKLKQLDRVYVSELVLCICFSVSEKKVTQQENYEYHHTQYVVMMKRKPKWCFWTKHSWSPSPRTIRIPNPWMRRIPYPSMLLIKFFFSFYSDFYKSSIERPPTLMSKPKWALGDQKAGAKRTATQRLMFQLRLQWCKLIEVILVLIIIMWWIIIRKVVILVDVSFVGKMAMWQSFVQESYKIIMSIIIIVVISPIFKESTPNDVD